jgi:hypothetical protein
MAFVSGPESAVWVPGAKARDESSEVANVRVTKGLVVFTAVDEDGRYGSKWEASEEGKWREGFGGGVGLPCSEDWSATRGWAMVNCSIGFEKICGCWALN